MKDNSDPQTIGNSIFELRRVGVPTLAAADAVIAGEFRSKLISAQASPFAGRSSGPEAPSQNGAQGDGGYPDEYMD